MKQFWVVYILDTNARGLNLWCWFFLSLLLQIQSACIETRIQSCWLILLSFRLQILQLVFEVILEHSLDQNYLSFLLFCLERFLSLDLISSFMLKVGSIFEEISSWASIADLQVVHFNPKRCFISDLKDLSNKVIISFVKLVDVLLLKQSNRCQKIFNKNRGREFSSTLEDAYQILLVEFIIEPKFFAKYHPFVETHPICFFRKIIEESFGVVSLFAEPSKCFFEEFVVENVAVDQFWFFFSCEHVRASWLVIFLGFFEQMKWCRHLVWKIDSSFGFYFRQNDGIGQLSILFRWRLPDWRIAVG